MSDWNKFDLWWYQNKNRVKVENIFGKRAEAICNRVDANLKVDNLYTDVLEKFAIKYNLASE